MQAKNIYKTNVSTMNDEVQNPFGKLKMALQYLIMRSGPMAMAASVAGFFARSLPELDRPDIQLNMQPLSADAPGEGLHKFSAFTGTTRQLRPHSRGEVRLKSKDPNDHPAIYMHYLDSQFDQRVIVNALKLTRKVIQQPALKSFIDEEWRPGYDVQSDDEILQYARETGYTTYHPVGTCKMGNDKMAVVDDHLRVYGIDGLRVADASIMPVITSGTTSIHVGWPNDR
jgi:choline dehydrogenase